MGENLRANQRDSQQQRRGRLRRAVTMAGVAGVVAAGVGFASAGASRPETAQALDLIDCEASQLVITGSNDVRRVVTSDDPVATPWTEEVLVDLSDDPTLRAFNQVGIVDGGATIYATVTRGADPDPVEKVTMIYDVASDTPTFVENPIGGSVAGAVNLFDDKFYFGTHSAKVPNPDDPTKEDQAGQYYRLDLDAQNNPTYTEVGKVRFKYLDDNGDPFRDPDGNQILPGGNGDITFSSEGDMYLVSSTAAYFFLYTVDKEQLDNVGTAALEPRILTVAPTGGGTLNGIAFGANGVLYISGTAGIRIYDPRTKTVSDPVPFPGTDIGSCVDPPGLSLQKNIPEPGRQSPTDQFNLEVSGPGIEFGNKATTTGEANGIQPDVVGPLTAFYGTQYTIKETAAGTADLAQYDITWSCIDLNDNNKEVGAGTGAEGVVTVPSIAFTEVECTFTNTPRRAEPAVLKSAYPPSGTEVEPGQVVDYTLSFDNSGGNVPAPVDYVDDISGVLDNATIETAPAVTGDGITVGPIVDGVFPITGELAAGAKATVNYSVKVNDPPNADFKLLNFLLKNGEDPPPDCVEPSTTCTVHPVKKNPSIELVKTATVNDVDKSGSNTVGDTITYTFKVTNTGNVTLNKIKVTDPLLGDEPMKCEKDTLAPGESMDCTAPSEYTLTADDLAAGKRENTASVVGTDPGGVEVKDTDSKEVPVVGVPGIQIVKAASVTDSDNSKTNTVGDKVSYTFKVTNTGGRPLTDVVVTDPLLGSGPMTCPKKELAVGESMDCTSPADYTLTAADTNAGKRTNTATVTGTDPDGKKVTDDDTVVVNVVRKPAPPTGANSVSLAELATLITISGISLVVIARRRRIAMM